MFSVDEMQSVSVKNDHDRNFRLRRLKWKTAGVLFFMTVVVSYMISWKIVKGPVNLTYHANSLLIRGHIKESLENYEKALEGNPRLTMAWTGKGLCLMYLGRFEEALMSYEQALILNPSLTLAWQGKGLSYESLGQYHEAIRCYEKGLAISPDDQHILRLKNNLEKRISDPAPLNK